MYCYHACAWSLREFEEGLVIKVFLHRVLSMVITKFTGVLYRNKLNTCIGIGLTFHTNWIAQIYVHDLKMWQRIDIF